MEIKRLSWPRRHAGRFRSRNASDIEWGLRVLDDNRDMEIELYDDRTVLTIEMVIMGPAVPRIEAVHARRDDEYWKELDYVLKLRGSKEGQPVLSIHLQTAKSANFIRLTLREKSPFTFRMNLFVLNHESEDLKGIRRGMNWAAVDRWPQAITEFERYRRVYSDRNPYVHFHLAHWHRELGEFDEARDHALRACALAGLGRDLFRPAYQEVEASRPETDIESLRILQGRASTWQLNGTPGSIVLDLWREARYDIAEAIHSDCLRSVLEVRGAEVARNFTRVGFGFEAQTEVVLYSSCRIIRRDDTVEKVPDERVTVRDAPDDHPSIQQESRRLLEWLLPRVEPGDLVETRFDLLRKGRKVNGQSWPGRVHDLCDPNLPTYRAELTVVTPADQRMRIVPLHCTPEISAGEVKSGLERTTLRTSRHVPAIDNGLEYASALLEPAVATGLADATWEELAVYAKEAIFGEQNGDSLPAPLAGILADSGSKQQALERCHAWVRDELKYASTSDAHAWIGAEDRAERILQSGVADCKDKSYLLHLVCRELGLPHHPVLFDLRTGRLCEDVPADIFDHVLLRAWLDGREVWLDATDTIGAVGAKPFTLQGMAALVLDAEGTVVRIGEDEPETNCTILRERLDRFENGRLAGGLEIEAHGCSARVFDRLMNSASMHLEGPQRGGSMALMRVFPELSLQSLVIDPREDGCSVFRLSGRHARCRLTGLSASGNRLARLKWSVPQLMHWNWEGLGDGPMLRLGFPLVFQLELELGPEIHRALVDRSVLRDVDNPLFSVAEAVEERGGALVLHREVVLRHGIVEDPLTALVPDLADAVASACGLVLSFDARGEQRLSDAAG